MEKEAEAEDKEVEVRMRLPKRRKTKTPKYLHKHLETGLQAGVGLFKIVCQRRISILY